jgi:hypothetical protein
MNRKSVGGGKSGKTRISASQRAKKRASSRSTLIHARAAQKRWLHLRLNTANCRRREPWALAAAASTIFFTPDLIGPWMGYKRKKEVDPIRLCPHPWEFALYFNV